MPQILIKVSGNLKHPKNVKSISNTSVSHLKFQYFKNFQSKHYGRLGVAVSKSWSDGSDILLIMQTIRPK